MFDISNFSWPLVSVETQNKISEFLAHGQKSSAQIITGFEKELEEYFSVKHALLTCNATSAAISCFHSLELGPGDEIIGPAFSHWGTILPASISGATIIFADTEPNSLSISLADIERKINSRTKAIVVCHLYGNPVDIVAIRQLCDTNKIALIEDISHAPGATVNLKPIGSFGDISFCSMQTQKAISAGEGGFILTNDTDLYEKCVVLGHPKRIHEISPKWSNFEEVSLGYKFRIAPLMALIGRESFHGLSEQNRIRKLMLDRFLEILGDHKQITSPEPKIGAKRVYWEYDFFLSETMNPELFSKELCKQGVLAGPAKFGFLPALPQFRKNVRKDDFFPNALKNIRRTLLLAPFTKICEDGIGFYASIFREITNSCCNTF